MRFRNLVTASVLLLFPILAHADDYTYNFNDTFSGFSAVGSITTDTNTGIVTTGDIVSYNIMLNDGTSALDLRSSNSQFAVVGGSVTATSSGLFFNFDDTNADQLLFQTPTLGSGNNYLCYQGVEGGCDDFDGAHESVSIGSDGQIVENRSGNLQIATTAIAQTPEPESLALLGTGLVGLVGIVRRRLVL